MTTKIPSFLDPHEGDAQDLVAVWGIKPACAQARTVGFLTKGHVVFPVIKNTPEDEDGSLFFAELEAALLYDDGLAAQEHLAAGHAIYYSDEQYPGAIVKQYPDGRRQLVRVENDGQISVVRDI